MRNRWRCGAAALVLLGALDDGAALAQGPLDFLFGQPPRPYRTHRRPPTRSPETASRESPTPVPRPHFPGDAPPAEQVVAKPDTAPAASRPEPPKSDISKPETTTPQTAGAGPPEPPPRPAELDPATPAGPMKPAVAPDLSKTAPQTVPTPPASPPPVVAPSGAAAEGTPRLPKDDPTCPTHLKAANIAAEAIKLEPQPDARCVVVEPVRLTGFTSPDGTKIDFPDKPTLACVTAETFVRYVSQMLSPLAKGTYGAPVAAVWTGPGFECRSRDHVFGAKLSEHGLGLAIDIAQLKLADDRVIAVGTPKTPADDAFEAAARAAGCGYFHTVLGPGSDSYHRTHWHFDLEPRGAKGDGKFCK